MSSALESKIEPYILMAADEMVGDRRAEALKLFEEFKKSLNRGEVRAATRDESGVWQVHTWVKRAILLGFRLGGLVDYSIDENFVFYDKETYPDRKSTRLNSSHIPLSRMPSSA